LPIHFIASILLARTIPRPLLPSRNGNRYHCFLMDHPFDETPEARRPDPEQSSTPPEQAVGQRSDGARSGDTNTGLRKALIEYRPRGDIFRPVLSRSPPTLHRLNRALSEPPAEQERRGSILLSEESPPRPLPAIPRIH